MSFLVIVPPFRNWEQGNQQQVVSGTEAPQRKPQQRKQRRRQTKWHHKILLYTLQTSNLIP